MQFFCGTFMFTLAFQQLVLHTAVRIIFVKCHITSLLYSNTSTGFSFTSRKNQGFIMAYKALHNPAPINSLKLPPTIITYVHFTPRCSLTMLSIPLHLVFPSSRNTLLFIHVAHSFTSFWSLLKCPLNIEAFHCHSV